MGVKGNSDNDYATALNMTCDFIGVPLIRTPSQKKFPSLNYDCFSRVRPSSGTQSLTELSSSQGIRFKPLYIFIENSIKDLHKKFFSLLLKYVCIFVFGYTITLSDYGCDVQAKNKQFVKSKKMHFVTLSCAEKVEYIKVNASFRININNDVLLHLLHFARNNITYYFQSKLFNCCRRNSELIRL